MVAMARVQENKENNEENDEENEEENEEGVQPVRTRGSRDGSGRRCGAGQWGTWRRHSRL